MSDDSVVAGAMVYYSTDRASLSFLGRSGKKSVVLCDARGRFTVRGLHSGALVMSARGEDWASIEPLSVPLGIAEEKSDIVLYVESAHRIRVQVVDVQRVSGVMVQASADDTKVKAQALSDAEDRFEIPGLRTGRVFLTGEGGGYLNTRLGKPVEVEGDVEDGRRC